MNETKRMAENVIPIRHRMPPVGGDTVGIKGMVQANLFNEKTGKKRTYITHNLIGNNGDIHYAERGAGVLTTALTNNFLFAELSITTGPAPAKTDVRGTIASYISGSATIPESGYPRNNDTDADNTGSSNSVVTWKYAYAKGDFATTAANIRRGIIRTTAAASTGLALLTHFVFASAFQKTTDDTLTIYINHAMLGTT